MECLRVSKCSVNLNFGVNYSIKSKSKADLCNNVENVISTALYLLVYEKHAMFLKDLSLNMQKLFSMTRVLC